MIITRWKRVPQFFPPKGRCQKVRDLSLCAREQVSPFTGRVYGAFALVFVGVGASKTVGHDALAVALAHGLTMAAFVSATLHICGGNPGARDNNGRTFYDCNEIASVSIDKGARNSFGSLISKTGRARCAAKKLVSGVCERPAWAVISHAAN
jgi:hypothetical protein